MTTEEDGQPKTRFYPLALERDKVVFFPLHWTVVHPITEESPLYGCQSEEQLRRWKAEFLVLITAVDDTFSQMVHTRSSYRFDEVVVGAKFANLLEASDDGMIGVDLRRLHDIEPVAL